MNVVLASNNAGKIKEFKELFKNFHITLIPQSELAIPEVEETGLTFVENALIKARHASRLSNLPALADDSGLCVPVLADAPGIYSARYATPANAKNNITKLLNEMASFPDEKRAAYFYCVLVFLKTADDPAPLVCEGRWMGSILHAPTGNEGFGYDPIFFDPTEKKSAAQLPADLKNKISHRGLALQSLIKLLPEKL